MNECVKGTPLVSVCVITYNHAEYIKECLDSLLAQKTNFSFEICIGEDGSEDGTREICREYARKYKDRVFLFERFRKDSARKKYAAMFMYNFLETLKACSGKYIAICEGDDYWHNPYKLQRQVAFMEANPNKGMVHSSYLLRNDARGSLVEMRTALNHDDKELHWRVIGQELIICTCSVLCRGELLHGILKTYPTEYQKFKMGDTQTWFHFARLHGIGYIDEVMCVYRKSSSGATASADPRKRILFLEGAKELDLYLAGTYNALGVWIERIERIFNRELLVESLVGRDMPSIRRYSDLLLAGSRVNKALVIIFYYMMIRSRKVIRKFVSLLERV